MFENPVLWTLVENIASSSTKQAWYTSSYHTDWGRPLRSHPLEHTEVDLLDHIPLDHIGLGRSLRSHRLDQTKVDLLDHIPLNQAW